MRARKQAGALVLVFCLVVPCAPRVWAGMHSPDSVVAGPEGGFEYGWFFVADRSFYLNAISSTGLSNVEGGSQAECLNCPHCHVQAGDTLRWFMEGNLVDPMSPGRVENHVVSCGGVGGGSSTTRILLGPTAHLDAPNGGEQLIVGMPAKISWTAVGGIEGVSSIDLFLSRNGPGGPWEPIATGEPNDGTSEWIVTGPGTNTDENPVYSAFIHVVAYDHHGNTGLTDESDAGVSLFDRSTETMVALFEAEPVESGVELRWQFGRPGQFNGVAVERSEGEDGPWTRLDVEARSVDGLTIVIDRAADYGKLYHYRLVGTTSGGLSTTLAQLSVRAGVPIPDFELSGVGPNPSHGPVGIDYAVAREARVSVTVVDAQGRGVARLLERILRPGRYHAVWSGELSRGGMAPSGVYFIRYQAPGKNLVRRVVMAR